MTQQIEPIEIFGRENKGVFLRVRKHLYYGVDNKKAEILDIYGNVLFTSILTTKTIEDAANQLKLTLKTSNTKELLTEIMEADAKDGLYEQEQRMYSEKEVLKLLLQFHKDKPIIVFDASEWFEQFKKQ
jgi:hypothetical protein